MVHGVFQFSSAVTELKPRKSEDFIWHHQGSEENPLWVPHTDFSGRTQLGALSNNHFLSRTPEGPISYFQLRMDFGLIWILWSVMYHVVNEALADHQKAFYHCRQNLHLK
jgi:hypothetical protein